MRVLILMHTSKNGLKSCDWRAKIGASEHSDLPSPLKKLRPNYGKSFQQTAERGLWELKASVATMGYLPQYALEATPKPGLGHVVSHMYHFCAGCWSAELRKYRKCKTRKVVPLRHPPTDAPERVRGSGSGQGVLPDRR
jgi:hypothetical protein